MRLRQICRTMMARKGQNQSSSANLTLPQGLKSEKSVPVRSPVTSGVGYEVAVDTTLEATTFRIGRRSVKMRDQGRSPPIRYGRRRSFKQRVKRRIGQHEHELIEVPSMLVQSSLALSESSSSEVGAMAVERSAWNPCVGCAPQGARRVASVRGSVG
ncbi:hypothetical protein [Rubripirellula obstinata]|nr:hypothetical protein [Rubripirellula obstinata]